MNKITDFCVKLSKLASKRRRSSSSINKPRLDRGFEHLEARKVLSSASFVGGVLSISGTTGNDTIAVRQVQGNIKIDGFTGSIPVSSIGQINISTGAGNDKVTLQMDAAVCRKVYADLGSGRDILETPKGVPVASMKGTESWGIGPSPVSPTPPPTNANSSIIGYWRGYFTYSNKTNPAGMVGKYHMFVTGQTGNTVTFKWYEGDAGTGRNGQLLQPIYRGTFTGTWDGTTFRATVPISNNISTTTTTSATITFTRDAAFSSSPFFLARITGTVVGADGGRANTGLFKASNSTTVPTTYDGWK